MKDFLKNKFNKRGSVPVILPFIIGIVIGIIGIVYGLIMYFA